MHINTEIAPKAFVAERNGEIALAFNLLEEAQEIVRHKTHDYFFDDAGNIKLTEKAIFEWLADRAIDEYKVGYQVGYLLNQCGHLMEPWLVGALGKQVEDESRHYRLLCNILPQSLQTQVRYRMSSFPTLISKDARWRTMVPVITNRDYVASLFELSLVFEGFASAALQVVASLPIRKIQRVYQVILRDEQAHFGVGKKFVLRTCQTSESAHSVLLVAQEAVNRANNCSSYDW